MNESGMQQANPIDVHEIMRVLLRRKWLLLLPWMVALLGGVAAAFLLKPIFFSNVTLQFDRPQSLTGSLRGITGGISSMDQQVAIMKGQVQSSLFLRNVVIASGVTSDAPTRTWTAEHAREYPRMAPND